MSDVTAILITGYSVAIFGFASSIVSLWIIYKIKILHNAFGLICAVQSIVDASALVFNVFVTFTIIAINPDATSSTPIIAVGLIVTFCNAAVTYLLLLKSINRLFAIMSPTTYHNIFTTNKTILYLLFVLSLSLIQVFLYAFSDCNLIYISTFFSWHYNSLGCLEKTGYLVTTWNSILTLLATVAFDGITLFYLRIFRKRLLKHDKKKLKANIRFFFQALLTTIFYIIMIISPRILRTYATTSYMLFLTATSNVLLFHTTNQFFFIVFTVFINKSMKTTSHVKVHVIQPKQQHS